MSHRRYTTAGFIVESRPYKEAGKILSIFTRDLGMVTAVAQGIRLGTSKLRYHMQDYALIDVSFVRGKEIWRLVGAERSTLDSHEARMACSSARAGVDIDPLLVRSLQVLRRLVQGEEKNEALFATILSLRDFLNSSKLEDRSIIESIIMLRVLQHLGYIHTYNELSIFLQDDSFAPPIIDAMHTTAIKSLAIKEINRALQESHL